MSAESKPGRFPELLRVRCPGPLPALIERTAERQCMSPSEYIRRCFVDGLKADGIDPAQLAGAGLSARIYPRRPVDDIMRRLLRRRN